jgi:hypothetical protein
MTDNPKRITAREAQEIINAVNGSELVEGQTWQVNYFKNLNYSYFQVRCLERLVERIRICARQM